MSRAISSLYDSALRAVLKDLPVHQDEFPYLPSSVKTSLARVMAKRGILTDKNIRLVLHDGILELDLAECNISPSSLQFVSIRCPRLRRLHLNAPQGCRFNIKSNVFCDVFSHCSRLQIVNLKCCTLMDNAAVICLTHSCPFIQSLCLSGCHMISDKSLVAISLKSRYLQALDITKTKVTTSGLTALSQGHCAKTLRELNVSHCLNVTDEGIVAITNNCPHISILVFHSCPLLTDTAKEATCGLPLKQVTWTVY